MPAGDPEAEADPRVPLTDGDRAVLDIIRAQAEGKGITGKDIVNELRKRTPSVKINPSTLTRHIIPRLKSEHGVKNPGGGRGYYIDAT